MWGWSERREESEKGERGETREHNEECCSKKNGRREEVGGGKGNHTVRPGSALTQSVLGKAIKPGCECVCEYVCVCERERGSVSVQMKNMSRELEEKCEVQL